MIHTYRRAGRPALWLGVLIFAITAVVSTLPAPVAEASENVNWHSYREGVALGKSRQKKVLINFYADWCSYCRKMDLETYADGAVARYVNQNFIAIRVNSDKENQIAAMYQVQSLPSIWFVAEDGEAISNLPGFVPPGLFINLLKYIHTESYKEITFKKFLGQQS